MRKHPQAGSGLPESVQQVADVIGRHAALRLVGALPVCGAEPWRRMVYVPHRLTPDHLLVRVLGIDDARAMVREFRGCILELACCTYLIRDHLTRAVQQAHAQGLSKRELAIWYGIPRTTIHRMLTRPPEAQHAANDDAPVTRRRPAS